MKYTVVLPSEAPDLELPLPIPRITSRKADITRRTPEAASWLWLGCWAVTLRTATLALVDSTKEYYAPAWCRSAHTRFIAPVINDALQVVIGCLHPTPSDNLPILAGIQPVELRRKVAALSLARRATEPGHLLHSTLTPSPSGNARHLNSKYQFVPTTQQIIQFFWGRQQKCSALGDIRWNAERLDSTTRLRTFNPDIRAHPLAMTLPNTAWVRTGVGHFRSSLHKWCMAPSVACECGVEKQTVGHVVLHCPIHRTPHGAHDLTVLDDKRIKWLLNTCPEI